MKILRLKSDENFHSPMENSVHVVMKISRKPHTCEFNGQIFLIYVYMFMCICLYILYVCVLYVCPMHTYAPTIYMLLKNTCRPSHFYSSVYS